MSQFVVNTVQGIGDIFWVYQKLAPYCDTLSLNIYCVDPNNTVQRRSEAFCRMLPKVRQVMFRKVPRSEYQRLARSRFSVQSVIGARNPVDYTVNAPLEAGVNLRDIDAHSKLDEFVDLGLPASVEREDYLCLFVAGAKSINVWKPDVWAKHAMYLARRLGVARIALIGAEWDRAVQSEVHRILALRHEVVVYVGSPLEQTLDIIRRSRYFFGYQSGLNVLAENYNVPQLMVYFPKLRSMLYTWCKPMSVRTIFHAMTFDCDAAKVIDALPLGISDEARTA